MKFKETLLSFFFLLLAAIEPAAAQICPNYKLVPDTILINVSDTFEIQEETGGGTPPTLWVCNWIDFGCDGIIECDSTTNFLYSFSAGGLMPVCYQINEPFLNNTEVCTTWVYVNDCSAPVLKAKANNMADSIYVCSGSQVNLSANATGGFSCPGSWQYSWYNGSTYYDGNDFLSFTEVWNSSFQTAQFDDLVSPKTFTVKARCSTFPACINTSSVLVKVAPPVQVPVFSNPPAPSRCQEADTLSITATAPNADHITYSLDNTSIAAGNTIGSISGQLIFTPAYTGPSTITATATGCNGPQASSLNLLTYPAPTLTLSTDTSRMCIGNTLLLPVTLTGTSPFEYRFVDPDSLQQTHITSMSNHFVISYVDTSEMIFTFYQLQDYHCTSYFDIKHWVLADSLPVYTPLPDTTLCEDASILLDLGSGSYQYLWLHDNSTAYYNTIDTGSAGTGLGANNIYVQITNGYCTLTDTAVVTFTVCAALSPKEAPSPISVFPNPATKHFFIKPFYTGTSTHIEIFSPAGVLVHEGTFDPASQGLYPVTLNQSGLYLIRCTTQGHETLLTKIVVQ